MFAQDVSPQHIGSINGLIIYSSVILLLIYHIFNEYKGEYDKIKKEYKEAVGLKAEQYESPMMMIEIMILRVDEIFRNVAGRKVVLINYVGFLLVFYACTYAFIYLNDIYVKLLPALVSFEISVLVSLVVVIGSVVSVVLLFRVKKWIVDVRETDRNFSDLEKLIDSVKSNERNSNGN